MKTNKNFGLIIMALVALVFTGCNVEVPPGYYGMVMMPDGFTDEVLAPGLHSCHSRQRMFLIDGKEETANENMEILCADDINLKFDLKARYRTIPIKSSGVFKEITRKKGASVKDIKLRGGGNTNGRAIPSEVLYETYLKPLSLSTTRGTVSKMEVMQVSEFRDKLQKEIFEEVSREIEGKPVELVNIVISNLDYPDKITTALEKKRKEELDLRKQEAKNALDLLVEENKNRLAQQSRPMRAAEAEADATYMRILGPSITKRYLRLKQIENKELLYGKLSGSELIISADGTPVIVNK
jgi:regulator of protease activity HflC (stomatin/prohibitin superfamily)